MGATMVVGADPVPSRRELAVTLGSVDVAVFALEDAAAAYATADAGAGGKVALVWDR
jgi:threonine dehydrogenase-like Zn-dependent dehydrogenase